VPPRWALALALLVLTTITTTTMGTLWLLWASTELTADVGSFLGPDIFPILLRPSTILRVWTDPTLLRLGLSFSLPTLFILLCHELGHYLACRRYRLPATLPYFLPLPLAIGTLGAFIRIRASIRSKRQLFDVGVAGPFAGFVALVPIVVLGILWSHPVPLQALPPAPDAPTLIVPGRSLLLVGLMYLVHGPAGAGEVYQLHPFVFAGWVGLLATSLNLIPLGQLDGGHILYAATGRLQRRLALPLWLGLLAVAVLFWPGWGVWCVVTLVMGLHHPPVRDEEERLDPVRRTLAWVALAIFVLAFMPVPIQELGVAAGG
jgi:membrane-associated protease RseP (regulator of RpoE activity)